MNNYLNAADTNLREILLILLSTVKEYVVK